MMRGGTGIKNGGGGALFWLTIAMAFMGLKLREEAGILVVMASITLCCVSDIFHGSRYYSFERFLHQFIVALYMCPPWKPFMDTLDSSQSFRTGHYTVLAAAG